MKVCFFGGGALRLFGVIRAAMADVGVLDNGEVFLYDLDLTRAEAMGRMLLKTPERARANCQIRWGNSLDEALLGADMVGVILPASAPKSYMLGHHESFDRGFISSDNISPNGAVSAVKIAPVLMNLARRMEVQCPNAWLINFVNPIAVLSAMVNNHTKIRCLGVCAGFTNHLSDISRIFGEDQEAEDLVVDCAGVNHLSYIIDGQWQGEPILEALNRHIDDNWKMCELQPWWDSFARDNITNSVTTLVKLWRKYGVMVFSSEGDGLAHLMYDDALVNCRKHNPNRTVAEVEAAIQSNRKVRQNMDNKFQQYLDRELDDDFWENHWKEDSTFRRQDQNIFVRIMAAIAGVREMRLATSRPNEGAIAGIRDDQCVEYSQVLIGEKIASANDQPLQIPDVAMGMTSALASHQTMLGNALALEDPVMLARALLTYPVRPFSRDLSELYQSLFKLAGDEIHPTYQQAVQYL
ncbi:hypothetical protein SH580_03390 [Coraliomargarita algicola]|uniref:Glycosyl hydrolase family 4 C-terminal domain-containing protein n=1 Tax=Coraliomargarita algicola TaxID=3092156 RepID=A0ABZ0RNQ3_9BACT|nr:hypothetical protein [Coraliomargarita sp. J2-16]WPJ96748.1 hypothetical protein SH580_03390 [Coraliomargarita sp. J2-16]